MTREARVISFDPPTAWPEEPAAVDVVAADQHAQYIQNLSKMVRTLYCICVREFNNDPTYGTEEMPKWDGDPEGRTGTKTVPVWPKIAETIARCGADPFQFIRSQFYNVRRSKPPYPNQIHSDKAVAHWEQSRLTAREELKHKIESDLNQIHVHTLPFVVNLKWDHVRALDYALRDQTCSASPLVRYCKAIESQLPVASRFRERALLQYMFQMPDYDELLGSLIPAELKAEAVELRRRVV